MADDDAQIRIGLGMDTSGLSAGKSQAEETADAIAAAYDRVAAAAVNLQQANSRISAINQEVKKGQLDNTTATRILSEEMRTQVAAAQALANAKRGLAAATGEEIPVVNEDTLAQEANTAAISSGISARQSAAASIGILEGRMMSGNRAAAAFLANTLGLGKALQFAFPVIGAAALLEVLGQIISHIAKFSSDAENLAAELNTNWLEGAIGQLTGLGKAVDQADKQIQKFAADNDAAKNRIAAADAEYARTTQGSIAGENVKAQQIQRRIDALEKEKALATQAAEAYGRSAQQEGQFSITKSPAGYVADRQKALEDRKLQEQSIAEYTSANLEQQALIAEKTDLIANAERETLNITRQIVEARIQAAHADDSRLNDAQQITAHLREEMQLHRVQQQFAAPGTAEASPELRKLRDRISLGQENHRVDELAHENIMSWFEEQQKAEKAAEETAQRDQRADAAAWRADHEEKMRGLEQETKASLDYAAAQQSEAEKVIAYREKAGFIRPGTAAQQRTAVSTATEQEQLNALQGEQSKLEPERGGKDLERWQDLQNQITEVMRKGAAQREQIAQQESLRIIGDYQRETQVINSALISGLNVWMTTSKKFGNAMADAAKHMAVSFIDQIAQMALKWAEHEAMMTILHLLGIGQRRSADASGAAIRAGETASTIAMNVTVAQSNAAVGATEVFAETGNPAAALAALAEGESLAAMAAFERGGIVQGRSGAAVPIMAHAREAVLPEPLTSLLMHTATSGAPGGGSHRFTSSPVFNMTVLDSRGLEGFARRAGDLHGREMMRYARRMNLTN